MDQAKGVKSTDRSHSVIRTVLFLLAFFAAGGLTFYFGSRKPEIYFPAMDKEKPQVLFLGDSNIDYGFEGTDIPVLLNEKTGMITYNGAVGGTCAGEPERIAKRTAYRSALNFNNLTRMMETGDFSGALRNRDFLEKNASGIENKALILGHLDYHAMDYVIVHYGLNDYMAGEPLFSEEPYDEHSYAGGLRSGVERLHKLCPNATVVLSSITFCRKEEEDSTAVSGREYDYGGGTIDEYRDAMKAVAEEYGYVLFLDNLEKMKVDDSNADQFMLDFLHLNQNGRERYVEGLMELISSAEEIASE